MPHHIRLHTPSSPTPSPFSSLLTLPSPPPSLQRSPRADHFTCFARVEHGPKLLAESGRLEGEGGEELSLKLETSVQCTASDPQSLDEIAQNPLLGEHTPLLKGGKRKEGGGGPPLKGGEGEEGWGEDLR